MNDTLKQIYESVKFLLSGDINISYFRESQKKKLDAITSTYNLT